MSACARQTPRGAFADAGRASCKSRELFTKHTRNTNRAAPLSPLTFLLKRLASRASRPPPALLAVAEAAQTPPAAATAQRAVFQDCVLAAVARVGGWAVAAAGGALAGAVAAVVAPAGGSRGPSSAAQCAATWQETAWRPEGGRFAAGRLARLTGRSGSTSTLRGKMNGFCNSALYGRGCPWPDCLAGVLVPRTTAARVRRGSSYCHSNPGPKGAVRRVALRSGPGCDA